MQKILRTMRTGWERQNKISVNIICFSSRFLLSDLRTHNSRRESSIGNSGSGKNRDKQPQNSYRGKPGAGGPCLPVKSASYQWHCTAEKCFWIVRAHLKIKLGEFFSVETVSIGAVSLANLCLPVTEFPWLNVKIIIITRAAGSLWVEFDVRVTFCLHDEVKIRLHFF